jgi:hypothetical protein
MVFELQKGITKKKRINSIEAVKVLFKLQRNLFDKFQTQNTVNSFGK